MLYRKLQSSAVPRFWSRNQRLNMVHTHQTVGHDVHFHPSGSQEHLFRLEQLTILFKEVAEVRINNDRHFMNLILFTECREQSRLPIAEAQSAFCTASQVRRPSTGMGSPTVETI